MTSAALLRWHSRRATAKCGWDGVMRILVGGLPEKRAAVFRLAADLPSAVSMFLRR
jgi:hypothetical protein